MKLAPVCVWICVCVCLQFARTEKTKGKQRYMLWFNSIWSELQVIAVENFCLRMQCDITLFCLPWQPVWMMFTASFISVTIICLQDFQIFIFNSPHLWVSDVTTYLAHWKHSTKISCFSYFHTTVSEYHDQGSLPNKHLIWRLMVLRVHDHHKKEYGSRQAGVLMEQ